ncbi:MAG: sigma-54-dependent Fis family transcriptional regulator [Candidatus Marinimicrobia bacterium]|nr:sigma-54-dependent Fis family transcriptional regulator [Candidatus Neomarinimicrobiota bacterium]
MKPHRILVVDDDSYIRLFLEETLVGQKYEVEVAKDGEQAWKMLQASPPDLVLSDLKMPKMDGLALLENINTLEDPPGVVLITAYGTVATAVQAMKLGAFDYLTKPFSITEIEARLNRYFEINSLRRENRQLKDKIKSTEVVSNMTGASSQLQDVLDIIDMVSKSDAPVFIQGESGTGKELVATAVHRRSNRADGPFLQTNCAAIPENLMESTLFGHVQGAFTGAGKTTKGLFEEADGGTLLLDEISEIPVGLQAKLLRVLQEQQLNKVGSHKTVNIDVRIIATTNQDIQQRVKDGRFREDLYYRLNVVPIHVPPLRERKGDIPLLVEHFVAMFCDKYHQSRKQVDADTMRRLEVYDWPGNVREMKNNAERAILFSGDAKTLTMNHFFPPVLKDAGISKEVFNGARTIAEVEREAILATLDGTGQNRTQAAKILDISVKTLRNKLKQYGIAGADQT